MHSDEILSEDESQSQSQDAVAPATRTPIPKLQLFILLLIQFAEPMTGLVIYPFVVQFVRETGITRGDETKSGFYAGLLESSFFLSEALTVYQFGRLSDIYGRRPVLLLAPLGLGLSMIGFGLSKSFWMLFAFRCAQGAFNGNLGVAKTVMSEISDPSNVADVFSYLQLLWSLGATTSPFIGGVLANAATKWPNSLGKIELLRIHPYFLPCLVAASVAFASFAFAFFGLRETLPSALKRARSKRGNQEPTETDPLLRAESATVTQSDSDVVPPLWELFTPEVRIALLNNSMLCLCDMAAESLIPLVYSTPIVYGGLGLKPYDIGLILGLCGIGNAIVQALLGGCLIRYFGPRRVFISAFCALVVAFSLYPLLSTAARRAGRVDAAVIVVLALQLSCTFVTYFAYAAVMLFVMDSAPNRASVGTVAGLSQMVGTISRGVAPSLASSLFSFSAKHNLVGGYMVYIVLTGITCFALRCSLMLPHRLTTDSEN
ncbi:major facilitator superfamily multidrug-resistance, DHA1 sub-family [Mycena haematopus]|nr:major facilitator superfamily multidrug-resistance, DHA1 sub-family [Mycena haematopus]